MTARVSDFKIAQFIIDKLCKNVGANFNDINVFFDDDIVNNNGIYIENSVNIAHTLYNIIFNYIEKAKDIIGKSFFDKEDDKNNFLVALSASLRKIMYKDTKRIKREEPYTMTLFQNSLIWIILKDIICPIYNKEIPNIKMIYAHSGKVDIAKFYKKEEIPENISKEPIIFVNDIYNDPIQNAYILIECLKYMEISPDEVIKKIYISDLYSKYSGFLDVVLDEEDVKEFQNTICIILGYDLNDIRNISLFDKLAQSALYPSEESNFWYLGIIEKMISPNRGTDWSVYQALEPYVKKFWDKVEEVKRKRKKEDKDVGVPFNLLLELKNKDSAVKKVDPNITIQSLLSSNRVW